jgi:GNAT superfamily N-acetyltransferase
MHVRQARADDHEAVVAFTEDTWPDHEATDYIPRVFPEWVESDGPDQRTFVAVPDGAGSDGTDSDGEPSVVGLCQAVMLSPAEGWLQGMRVHPDYRGRGVTRALNDAAFAWTRERGATVARNMVFSWNVAGLGAARAVGFEPGVEFRWLYPEPDADARPESDAARALRAVDDADAGWHCWQRSRARDALDGLALDLEEGWALAKLTRDRLHRVADDERLFVVQGEVSGAGGGSTASDGSATDDDSRAGDATAGGTRGLAFRVRDYERDAGKQRHWAEYGVGAWADLPTARALLAAIRRDAATLGADATRLLVPETPRHVSDAARVGVEIEENPDFVLEADLSVLDPDSATDI